MSTDSNKQNGKLALSTNGDVASRLAKMVAMGVSVEDIAQATMLPASQVADLVETPDVQKLVQEYAAENIDTFQTLNQAWDNIEQFGALRVLEALRNNPDPDFALRASIMANKAQRRGPRHNFQVATPRNGEHVVVHLTQRFTDRLQQSFTISREEKDRPQKSDDSMALTQAERVLSARPPAADLDMQDADGLLSAFDNAMSYA